MLTPVGFARSSGDGAGRRSPAVALVWPSRTTVVLGVIAAIACGCAVSAGQYSPLALALVGGAAAAALLLSGAPTGGASPRTWAFAAVIAAVGNLSPGLLPYPTPGGPSALTTSAGAVSVALSLALAASVAAVILGPAPGLRRGGLAVAVAADMGLIALGWHWGHSGVDMFSMTQGGAAALLHGHDPYLALFPEQTPPLAHVAYGYGPGLLLLTAPGRVLGDVRSAGLAALVALIAGVAVLARRHGGPEAAWRCLAVLLALPLLAHLVDSAFPEVYPAAAVAGWLVLRRRHPRWAVAVLGLGLATVPTAAPLLVLPWIWWRRTRREISWAAGVALGLCLPFALWTGVSRFVSATVLLYLRLSSVPWDLTLNGLVWHLSGHWLPGWVGVAVGGGALLAMAGFGRRRWRSALDLGATLMLAAVLVAKFAGLGAYFLTVTGFVLVLALTPPLAGPAGRGAEPGSAPLERPATPG